MTYCNTGCGRVNSSRGLCSMHRRRMQNWGELEPNNLGKHQKKRVYLDMTKHPHWKGGRINRRGYIYLKRPEHPNSDAQNYIAEHRVVMEEKIGRYLKPEEAVHHIDGNRSNNEPDNLQLFSTHGEHTKVAHPEVAYKARKRNYKHGKYAILPKPD